MLAAAQEAGQPEERPAASTAHAGTSAYVGLSPSKKAALAVK